MIDVGLVTRDHLAELPMPLANALAQLLTEQGK